MHARRYFLAAEPTDTRTVEALAYIRTLYAVEKELKDERGRLANNSQMTMRWGGERPGPGQSWGDLPTGSNFNTEPRRRRVCSGRRSTMPGTSGHPLFDTWTTTVRHRQRGGRAGHSPHRRRPGQLAADRRRRRVEDRLRPAERLRQRDAATSQPVVESPRRTRSTRRPFR